MNISFSSEKCPICNKGIWHPLSNGIHKFRHGRRPHVVNGMHFAVCDECNTQGFLQGQRDENQGLIQEYMKTLIEYVSPSDILALREKYLLTQEQAGMIFGGGKQGFSKWERGMTAPAGPTARLIKLALKNPDSMRELAVQAGIQLPKPVEHNRRRTDGKGNEVVVLRFVAVTNQNEVGLDSLADRDFRLLLENNFVTIASTKVVDELKPSGQPPRTKNVDQNDNATVH